MKEAQILQTDGRPVLLAFITHAKRPGKFLRSCLTSDRNRSGWFRSSSFEKPTIPRGIQPNAKHLNSTRGREASISIILWTRVASISLPSVVLSHPGLGGSRDIKNSRIPLSPPNFALSLHGWKNSSKLERVGRAARSFNVANSRVEIIPSAALSADKTVIYRSFWCPRIT